MRRTLFLIKKFHPVPAIVWGLFILFVTCIPGQNVPELHWIFIIPADKWAHLAIFTIFSALFVAGLHLKNKLALFGATLYAFSCALLLGVVTELLQQYVVPSRHGDWADLAADGFGGLLGVLSYVAVIFWLRSRVFRQ